MANQQYTTELAKNRTIKTTNKSNFHINKQMGHDAAKDTLILQLIGMK